MKAQQLSSLPVRYNSRALAFLNASRRGLASFAVPKTANEPNVCPLYQIFMIMLI